MRLNLLYQRLPNYPRICCLESYFMWNPANFVYLLFPSMLFLFQQLPHRYKQRNLPGYWLLWNFGETLTSMTASTNGSLIWPIYSIKLLLFGFIASSSFNVFVRTYPSTANDIPKTAHRDGPVSKTAGGWRSWFAPWRSVTPAPVQNIPWKWWVLDNYGMFLYLMLIQGPRKMLLCHIRIGASYLVRWRLLLIIDKQEQNRLPWFSPARSKVCIYIMHCEERKSKPGSHNPLMYE